MDLGHLNVLPSETRMYIFSFCDGRDLHHINHFMREYVLWRIQNVEKKCDIRMNVDLLPKCHESYQIDPLIFPLLAYKYKISRDLICCVTGNVKSFSKFYKYKRCGSYILWSIICQQGEILVNILSNNTVSKRYPCSAFSYIVMKQLDGLEEFVLQSILKFSQPAIALSLCEEWFTMYKIQGAEVPNCLLIYVTENGE
jgi:hypothetical protein